MPDASCGLNIHACGLQCTLYLDSFDLFRYLWMPICSYYREAAFSTSFFSSPCEDWTPVTFASTTKEMPPRRLFSVLINEVSTLKVRGDIRACATCRIEVYTINHSDRSLESRTLQKPGGSQQCQLARTKTCCMMPHQVRQECSVGSPHHVQPIEHLISDV